MTSPMRTRVHSLIASALSLAALLATLWRLERGIDFTDEAFYLAMPLRFVLGDRPFIDELNVAQTTAILLYPFVKLNFWLRGTTGIFLFIRVLYVVFFVLVASSVYRLAAVRLPTYVAILTGAACIAFVPYGIPGLSYNTVGAGMLTIGLCTTTRALLLPDRACSIWRDGFYWGGAALAAAVFAYPSLVPLTGACAAVVFALARGRRASAFARVGLGGGSFAVLVSPLFALAGPSHLSEVLAYSAASVSISPSRFALLWTEFLRQHLELPLAFLVVIALQVLARILPLLVLPVLPFLPLLALGTSITATRASMAYVISFACLGPLFALGLRDTRTTWILTLNAWLPSALAGALTGWSSGNGAIAAAVGSFPAAMVSGVLLALWVHELAGRSRASWPRVIGGYSPLVPLAVMLKLLLSNDAVFLDGKLAELTARVTEGPYKGLLTTPDRRRLLAARSAAVLRHARTGHALFYYDFPAGYLISAQRPLVASAWVFPVQPRASIDVRFFERKATRGDLIFSLDRNSSSSSDPLDRIVRARASEVLHEERYRIWIVR